MGLREAQPSAAGQPSPSWTGTAGVATAAMAAAMLALYAASALSPALAQDMQLPRSAVDALVTATFALSGRTGSVNPRLVSAHASGWGDVRLSGFS